MRLSKKNEPENQPLTGLVEIILPGEGTVLIFSYWCWTLLRGASTSSNPQLSRLVSWIWLLSPDNALIPAKDSGERTREYPYKSKSLFVKFLKKILILRNSEYIFLHKKTTTSNLRMLNKMIPETILPGIVCVLGKIWLNII